jgi:hypothetical protein
MVQLGEYMDARTAADLFQRWAVNEGLMSNSVSGSPPSISSAEKALINPITDSGRNLLRSKQVQAVAFNDAVPAVIVLLRRAAPSLKRQSIMPAYIDDVPVNYRQGVQNAIEEEPAAAHSGPTYVIRIVSAVQHYACGSSISVGNAREAGTLGCLVRDAAGVLYGLSNNHITGGCSFAGVGLPILAPGVYDVVPNSLSPFTLGFHHAALPLVAGSIDNIDHTKNLDAAIFRIPNASLVSSYQGTSYDTPETSSPLLSESVVEKVGRTTGHTHGKVVGQLNGAHSIPFAAALYNFSGLVFFEQMFAIAGTSELFSDNGDSGSLITSVDQQRQRTAVGIVVGGMTDSKAVGGKLTLALSIERILEAFQVTIVSGHNI